MRINPVKILTNGSMATNANSIGIDLNQHILYSVQAVWTGSPTGTLELQISNDIVPVAPSASNFVGPDPAANVVNWSTYTGSTQNLTGATGNFMWNVYDVGYRWVRLVYNSQSGTGNLNATFFGKSV